MYYSFPNLIFPILLFTDQQIFILIQVYFNLCSLIAILMALNLLLRQWILQQHMQKMCSRCHYYPVPFRQKYLVLYLLIFYIVCLSLFMSIYLQSKGVKNLAIEKLLRTEFEYVEMLKNKLQAEFMQSMRTICMSEDEIRKIFPEIEVSL